MSYHEKGIIESEALVVVSGIKPWRRRLLWTLVIIFVGLGGGAVFYAQGWRLDPGALAVKKMGAIYIRSFPADAVITLNGKPVKRSRGLFDSGTLVNLFPKTYALELTLSGYHPWKESVTVAPAMVAELKYAVLVPAAATSSAEGIVNDFWIVNREPLVKTASGTLAIGNTSLPGTDVLGWTEDRRTVLTKDAHRIYANDLSGSAPARRFTRAGNVSVDSARADHLIITTPTTLSLFDLTNGSTTLLERSSSLRERSVASSRVWIAWTAFNRKTNTSTLVLYNKSSQEKTRVASSLPGDTVKMSWSKNGLLGIVQNDGEFFIYDSGEETLKKIASDARSIAWSEDGTLVAALESWSIELFSQTDNRYWRFNTRNVGEIERLTWYRDKEHLFLHLADRVIFLDLNDAGLLNLIEVARTKYAEYDTAGNQFYFLESGGKLMRLQFPF